MQEVVARSCSTFYQKDFLKITQNLQKNTCPRVSQVVRVATSLKRNPRTGVSEPGICKCSLE